MTTFKRSLAMLLCALMLLSATPLTALAETVGTDVQEPVAQPQGDVVNDTAASEPEAQPAATAADVVKVEKAGGETTYHSSLQDAFKKHFDYTNNTAMGGTYTVTLLSDCDRAEISAKTDSYIAEPFNITLDLNGHTIQSSDSTKSVLSITIGSTTYPSTFTVTDSVGTGKITGGKWGIVFGGAKATLNFNGGTITGNHGGTTGGGICASATSNQPVINLNGGVITGNSVTGTSSANTGLGGGVYACQINLNGTVITGNYAYGGTGKYTGRGGGIATPINGTKTYNIININASTVYGNFADNAGDDLMICKNGNTYHSLSLSTSNWYIDGWNGKSQSVGSTDRYNAEAPVAYTDGGFEQQKNINLGLKYVAASTEPEQPVAPAAPYYDVATNDTNVTKDQTAMTVVCTELSGKGHEQTWYYHGEAVIGVGEVTEAENGGWTCVVTFDTAKYIDTFNQLNQRYEEYVEHKLADPEQTSVNVTLVWNAETEKWDISAAGVISAVCEPKVTVTAPALPEKNGGNVTKELITILCDTDADHTAKTYGWLGANIVYPVGSEPVWNEDLNAWTISVRIDSIEAYYTGLNFDKEHNGIVHHTVKGAPLTSDEFNRIDTTLVWDAENEIWQTLTGKPFELHVTCQTTPEAPAMGFHLGNFQIKVIGNVNGEEKIWHESLHAETVTVGQVKGNRTDGFTVDVTVTLADGDAYLAAWMAKHAPEAAAGDYVYDWSKTNKTVTFTLKYTGNTTGELYDGPEYWAAEGEKVCTAYVTACAPAVPDKLGANVINPLLTVICDTDDNHADVTAKWYSTSCKVYPSTSTPVWDAELQAWTIGVRIQSLTVMYVNQMEDANNNITHTLVGDASRIVTLKWDETQSLWVPTEPIEIHCTCKTIPDAPTHMQLKGYQIQVYGIVNGEEKLYAINLSEGSYTVGEVKGSREDGFTVDITVNIAEDDSFQSGWIAKRDADATVGDYAYNWSKTPETVTFTLKYNGDLTGTLYGNRHGANTNYDWILGFKTNANGSVSPVTYGAVGQAYLIPSQPEAPEQKNVTDKLVAIICDSDPTRHETVYGKWYPQHCRTTSDIVWNTELNAWTVDVRIGSLYIMYVDQLEDANGGTLHELVEDITTVFTTLKWDTAQNLWVPVEDIELHTTCRTAPLAPAYRHQLDGYQIKVKGDVDGDGVFGESPATNNKVGEVYTTSIPEDGYTISEVYGSREEGFFVDVTVTLSEGDIYQKNWIEKCNPGFFYNYDWEKTPETVTFTLVYTGDLNGTLYGNRYASNTNVDWVLSTTGKDYGVVAEAYVNQVMANVQIVIYRNGDVNVPYKTISLGKIAKGTVMDLTELDIADYYTSANGYQFEGWFNDGKWNQYKAGNNPAGLEEITINGWTNLICMVTDYQKVVVRAVTNGDKDNAEVIFTGKALKGENLIEWLNANVEIPAKDGYKVDKWYNWDWYGHKHTETATVNGWTNVYITYSPITYTIKYNAPDGKYVGSEPNRGSNWMLLKNAYTYDAPVTLHDGTGFQRSGYKLIGWNIKGVFYELGETVDVNFTKVQNGTVQAYAVWEVLPLNVYYYVEGELVGSFTVTDESEIMAFNVYDNAYFTAPEKTGYTLLCWYEKAADIGNTVKAEPNTAQNFVNKKVLRLYGAFEANQYTLTLDPNGGKVDPTTVTVTYDAPIGELPAATRTNYIFDCWVDAQGNEVTAETVYTVAGDSTVTAKWIQYPGSGSTNVTNELFTIQCTEIHEHSWLCNWFGSHVKLVTDSVKWNEELGRWEAQAKIGSSMMSMINSTQPKKNYFGGIKHYYDTTDYVFDLYYDPNFTGLNSQKKEVTGMWLPVKDYVVDVYCYTEPSMPDVSKITSTVLWMRDAGNKMLTHSQKYTVKQLVNGTYTLGQMYTENGKFYVKLTLTDLAPYIQALGEKTGKTYVIGDWQNHLTLKDCVFTLVYTGSTTDYKQDGTGWSVDTSSWNNNSEKINGKSLWLTEQFTVTYTDGVEDKEIFADQVFTVNAYTENGATKNAVTDFDPTATPTFEIPEYTGYSFAGWTPEWAETVTGDASYTATWTANTYTVTFDTNGGPAVEPKVVTFDSKYGILPTSPLTGLSSRKTDWYLVDENGNVTDTQIKNTTVVSVARDHTLFLKRDVLAPTLKITLEVPGAISNDYKYYVPGNSTRILTVTVNNMNADVLDYTYAWYKDGVLIEGETEAVLTLPGNVSDSGTYKVVVTAKLKDGSAIVVMNDTASAEKEQKVQIMRASNTLRYNANYGETPATSDSYFGGATATVKGSFDRTGYTLTGWNTKADGTGDTYVNGDTVSFPGDNGNGGVVLELFAQWKANEYTVTFNTNGGPAAEPKVVTFDSKYGTLPTSPLTGLSSRKNDWYLVDENGNVTDTQIKNTTVVSVARDHTLFLKRDVLAPTLKITLEVPGAISNDYKYYVPGNSTRILTVTVNNMNADVLDYTYAWYKDGVLIEGETEAVLTLPGNVSDSGTYKVVVTAKLKDGSTIVVMNDTASGEKEQKVEIKHAANTLYYDANGGEGGPSSNYTGGTTLTVQTGEPTRVGYTFTGWNTKADGTGDAYKGGDSFTFADDNGNGGCEVTLYAQWTGNIYEITLNANGGSFPVEEGDPAATVTVPVTYGSPIGELPTPVLRGHTFAGWTDADGNAVTAETIYSTVGNTSLTAQWTANTYTITFDGGTVDPEKITVTYGQPIGELPTPKLTGWRFANWDDPNGKMVTAQTVYDYDCDIVLSAVWWAKEIDPDSPQTGDQTTMVVMSTLILSAAGLIVLILSDRKRRAAK